MFSRLMVQAWQVRGEGRRSAGGDGAGVEIRGALGDGVLRRHTEVGQLVLHSSASLLFTEVSALLPSGRTET